jgi:hypothetical protein
MKNGKFYGLAIADIHFGKKDDKKLYDELEEFFINKIIEEGSNLDFVQVNGDTFDRQIKMNEESAKLVSQFILTLNELSIEYDFKLRFLKGTLSHDFNQLEVYRKLEITNPNFRIFTTITIDEIDPINNVTFLQMPEEYVEDFDKHYGDYLNLEEGCYDMVFFHGTFDFAGYVHNLTNTEKHMKNAPTFKVSQFENNVYGPVIGGHIHTRMEKGNVYYSGSPSRFGFGEEADKGFYEIYYDLEDCSYELNFIVNEKAPTYMTINLDDLPDDIVEKTKIINDFKSMYDFIRIKSSKSVDSEQDLQMLKQFAEKDTNLKVEVIKKIENEENKKYEFVTKEKYDKPTTIQKYIEIKNEVKIPLDVIKEVLTEL